MCPRRAALVRRPSPGACCSARRSGKSPALRRRPNSPCLIDSQMQNRIVEQALRGSENSHRSVARIQLAHSPAIGADPQRPVRCRRQRPESRCRSADAARSAVRFASRAAHRRNPARIACPPITSRRCREPRPRPIRGSARRAHSNSATPGSPASAPAPIPAGRSRWILPGRVGQRKCRWW